MPIPTDKYPSRNLTDIKQKPIGTAKYQEPIFRRGVFQNQYIEVVLTVYPVSHRDPSTGKELIAVRFGQMPVVRFVDRNLLYEIKRFEASKLRQ